MAAFKRKQRKGRQVERTVQSRIEWSLLRTCFSVPVLLLVMFATLAFDAVADTGLSQDQARKIVLMYLESQGYRTTAPNFDLENDPSDPELPDYYMFHAYYNEPSHLASIDSYAVNRRTAELWERLECKCLRSKGLEALQKDLRKQQGLSGPANRDQPGNKPCF